MGSNLAAKGPGFRAAEESFLASQRVPKPTRTAKQFRRAVEAVTKLNTVEFFKNLLTDDLEAQIWMVFITGKAPVEENGQTVIKDVELNPISLKAFLRAVEYKRGLPVVTVKGEDEKGQPKTIEINVIGATPEYFEKAAKAKGFLTRSV